MGVTKQDSVKHDAARLPFVLNINQVWLYSFCLWLIISFFAMIIAVEQAILISMFSAAVIGTGVLFWRAFRFSEPVGMVTRLLGGSSCILLVWILSVLSSGLIGNIPLMDVFGPMAVSMIVPTLGFIFMIFPSTIPNWVAGHMNRPIALLGVLALLAGWGQYRQSEAFLRWNFSRHQTDLEELVRIYRKESRNYYHKVGEKYSNDDYELICRRAGVRCGNEAVGNGKEQMRYIVISRGIAVSGWSSGYEWSTTPPVPERNVRYSPLVGNWYIFYEGN